MSNFLILPQLAATFSIVNNAGWYDIIAFTQSPTNSAPLDLTGLNFHAELRLTPTDANNQLDMSTTGATPYLINGNTLGTLSFSVPASKMQLLKSGIYSMDIVVTDQATGNQRNLFESGPATVTILQGVTR